MENCFVRPFADDDTEAVVHVFYRSVREGTSKYYNARERRAWVERAPDIDTWRGRLTGQKTLVAEVDGKISGFMTLAADGYIDLAFVIPEVMGKGVAKALYDDVENLASQSKTRRLYADASYFARDFFTRQGWSVVKEQTVTRGTVDLTSFLMEKYLE